MSPLPDPVDDEALKNELLADGAQNTVEANEIRERARHNASVVAAFDAVVGVLIRVGGIALATQVPGSGVVVEPIRDIAHAALEDAFDRWKGANALKA